MSWLRKGTAIIRPVPVPSWFQQGQFELDLKENFSLAKHIKLKVCP
jgi:hypothetical protein